MGNALDTRGACTDDSDILVRQFPEAVDDYVATESPARFIDAFVDGLDLSAAGFATFPILGKYAFATGLSLSGSLTWRFLGAALPFWVLLIFKKQWRVPLPLARNAFLLGAIWLGAAGWLFRRRGWQ